METQRLDTRRSASDSTGISDLDGHESWRGAYGLLGCETFIEPREDVSNDTASSGRAGSVSEIKETMSSFYSGSAATTDRDDERNAGSEVMS